MARTRAKARAKDRGFARGRGRCPPRACRSPGPTTFSTSSTSRGEPTHAVLGTVNMLQKVVAERRPHMFVVAMDSKGPTFRHALDARYKATRPAPPPDLSQQMARVHEIIHAWDVACFERQGFEADDL